MSTNVPIAVRLATSPAAAPPMPSTTICAVMRSVTDDGNASVGMFVSTVTTRSRSDAVERRGV